MRMLLSLVLSACATVLCAQRSDTLRFHSAAFGTERTVVVHLPEFHRYASAEVRMPVIILLDGQHEWFIDPLLNDIRYLQYTHEVPQAIVVTVPHADRMQESAADSIDQPDMPLLELLTVELPPLLQRYDPGDITVLVGHSFTASFVLHAYLRAPGAFDAVIALSPLHLVGRLMPKVADRVQQQLNERVLVAVGGSERFKDGGHHGAITAAMREAVPARTDGRLLFKEYPSAGHTSLPIIAFPELLATLFRPYSLRDSLAAVDDEYRLNAAPPPPEELMRRLEASWTFLSGSVPWDLAEANGLISRLEHSGYADHVIMLLRRAITLYPNEYGFHAWLGQALLEREPVLAEQSLRKALEVQAAYARDDADYAERKAEIEGMLKQ
jgi:predicted alpha/beta superfamily hydrolase